MTETDDKDNTIAATFFVFESKVFKVENKYLRHHAQILVKDLDLLDEMYLEKHKLTSNALGVQFCKLARVISNYFSYLLPTNQVKMIYTILNKDETHLLS